MTDRKWRHLSPLCFTFVAIANIITTRLVFCEYLPCSTAFVIFFKYLLCIIFVFVVFTLINNYDTFQWLLIFVHTHARTHAHYDILSDIMIILDHGNICVDTIFIILLWSTRNATNTNVSILKVLLIHSYGTQQNASTRGSGLHSSPPPCHKQLLLYGSNHLAQCQYPWHPNRSTSVT